MVRPIYSDKKGIYKDLYRTINSDNQQQEKPVKRQRKGIYANLYRQFYDDARGVNFRNNKEEGNSNKILIIQVFKNTIKNLLSKISFFFSAVATELKLIAFAFVVAKKPIDNYIENNLSDYQYQGNHYNE